MSTRVAVPERLRVKFINDVLDMYARGEVSAARAASMLGIPLAQFYELVEKGYRVSREVLRMAHELLSRLER